VSDPRALLAKHGLRPKKSWGQNFLVDERVYRAIVAAAVQTGDEDVVEIGAGLGTLTQRLAAATRGRVVAVERDRDMLAVLEQELAALPNVEIRAENALALDYASLATRGPLVVAGNLPYQIASPLLFGVLEARAHVRRAVLMLQEEMADRLLAAPGTSEYGAFGVMVTMFADVRPVVRARSGSFHPRPRVDSTVVEVSLLPGPRLPLRDERLFGRVVHAAFGQRRKTLRNALRAAFPDADDMLARAGIDPGRRGETLTLEEFAALTEAHAGAA
jgi:16S rRNA (adenine1518-N6/adenine1519-N6)-dimethyltransferase